MIKTVLQVLAPTGEWPVAGRDCTSIPWSESSASKRGWKGGSSASSAQIEAWIGPLKRPTRLQMTHVPQIDQPDPEGKEREKHIREYVRHRRMTTEARKERDKN